MNEPAWTPMPPTISRERALEIDRLTRTSIACSVVDAMAAAAQTKKTNPDDIGRELVRVVNELRNKP